jgi:hypothetical protein
VEARGAVPRLGRAWRRRLGWYPGDWIWPSLLALLVAALAGIGAAAFVAHDNERPAYVTATSPFATVTSTIAPPERTAPSGTTAPTTGQPGEKPSAPLPSLRVWPPGRSGWTVVLQSLPKTSGRAFALAQARAAEHSGVKGLGIIDSSEFSSLHPGYYLLFSGVYDTLDDANAAVTTARSHGYPRASARQITP